MEAAGKGGRAQHTLSVSIESMAKGKKRECVKLSPSHENECLRTRCVTAANTCLAAVSVIVVTIVAVRSKPLSHPRPCPRPRPRRQRQRRPRRIFALRQRCRHAEMGSVPASSASYGASVLRSCQSHRPASSSVDVHCSAAFMWSTDTAIRTPPYLSCTAESGVGREGAASSPRPGHAVSP
ncbi:hypothetical protein F5148DRAFT_1239996 [Russula earlei]|uniref:Uncharacterized protein n=1 Tax=Russula earlei TaxID=71964 RepID=A0ACC0TVZ6_9AGAM|nr:hypothetical protein F5148DRAFT_1239996 [Russula earlei]